MRFMVMHKQTAAMEAGEPPSPEVIEGVGKLIGEGVAQKVFVSGEGLKPSSTRTHLVYKDGVRTAVDGPFTETKELIGGFALMSVRSKEEMLEWCDRFAAVVGDVELHVGPVNEPWDLGMAPKPEGAPLRYLSMVQMRDDSADAGPDPAVGAKLGALIEEMTKAGVMQATGGLFGTAKGARIRFDGGKHTVIDGPFAESKELIAGYAILDLPSKEEAVKWAVRFGAVVQVEEVEVRQMAE